jgi:hypothetical protein
MPSKRLNDPNRWYDRAAEMRAIADGMTDNETKAITHRLADDYDKLGDRTMHRTNGRHHGSAPKPGPKP